MTKIRLHVSRRAAVLAAALAAAAVAALPIAGEAGAYDQPWPNDAYRNFPGNGTTDTGYFRFPSATVGKFYFVDNGVNSYCSGSVMNGPHSGGIVYLAAHCLFDVATQTWTTNWVFAPARDNGTSPFGTWSWRYGEIWQPYAQHGDNSYDYGVVIFYPNNGSTLLNKVGGLGMVWNAPFIQHWHVYGYPVSDSERQWICTGSWAGSDLPGNEGAPPTVGIGCNKAEQGMSGGPWMMQTQPGGQPAYLNGVSSYTYAHNDLYSPYWDSNANRMYADMEAYNG